MSAALIQPEKHSEHIFTIPLDDWGNIVRPYHFRLAGWDFMALLKNLSGKRFTRLLVVSRDATHGRDVRWICICDCGVERIVPAKSLLSGRAQSCGCLRLERVRSANTLHGGAIGDFTPEYKVWRAMLCRCRDANTRYARNGVRVCKRWQNSFSSFLRDMGARPLGSSIERIKNHLGYTPRNCRWATATEQANNRSTNRILKLGDASHTVAEWARITGIKAATIVSRIQMQWPLHKVLTQPTRKIKAHVQSNPS